MKTKKNSDSYKNKTKKRIKWQSLENILKKAFYLVANPRFLLCFGIAWFITNGWSYLMMGLGTVFQIHWMIAVSGAYIAFLWIPMTPEKIITIAISILLMKKIFPDDKKTLGLLHELHERAKIKKDAWKIKRKDKKEKNTKKYKDDKNENRNV